MATWKVFLLPCMLLLLDTPAFTQQSIEPKMLSASKGTFLFNYLGGDVSYRLTIFYCRPNRLEAITRIIFVMHGSEPETAKQVCQIAGSYSEKFGAVIVAPQFATKDFPGDSYVFGNMLDNNGSMLPKEQWGFMLIENLFDELSKGLGLTESTYDIVGFSGGGQFVQRLILFLPEARFRRAIAGSPGKYAFPTFANRFPYGLLNSPTKPSDLSRIFSRNFILLLGDADIVDRTREEQAELQGTNRFARGLRFFATATEEADNLVVPLAWQIQILHGVNHDAATVISKAFDLLAN
jgi:hypothetical protein